MIVKNSGQILKKVLESVKPIIDHWTILDTGSTDGTQHLIKECLHDKEGQLFEEQFIDFMSSRNRSLDLSSKKCKYTLILDDSYVMEQSSSTELVDFLKNGDKKAYMIYINSQTDHIKYGSMRIIRSDSCIRYKKYRVHEYLTHDNDREIEYVPDTCYINDAKDTYHVNRSYERFKRDVKILMEDSKSYPKDTRIVYYLANTYDRLGDSDNAVKYHKKLLGMKKSTVNEKYDSMLYLNSKIKNKKDRVNDLIKIVKLYPSRIDSWFLLFMEEYNIGQFNKAYKYITYCMSQKEPTRPEYSCRTQLYRTYIPYFFIDTSVKIGHIDRAVDILKRQLQLYPQDQRFLNIKYQLTEQTSKSVSLLSNGKTVVIHTGDDILSEPWNKNNIHTLGSGSEIMAINLAEDLSKKGFRVFLFGHFYEEEINIDYQGIVNGVQYIDYTRYDDFLQQYYIDVLIVSRFVDKLVYYSNVNKVFLWVHDILPLNAEYIFQTHSEKFKNVLSMSTWHSKKLEKEYHYPKDLSKVWGNYINSNRFDKYRNEVKRIPYRFIWTSSPYRGVGYAVDMIKNIKSRYDQATLYIFGDEHISPEVVEEIKQLDYITIHPRVSQDTLSIELLKSHVWLYPNHFEETYCISAVEAQYAGCLVCTNVHAGLEDTVGDRGAVIRSTEYKPSLLDKLYEILDNEEIQRDIIDRGLEYAKTQLRENKINMFIETIS